MLLAKDYKPIQPSDRGREISLVAWGFTLGFSYLTARKGYKQTSKIPRSERFKLLYVWLVWLEMISILGYGGLTWFSVHNHCPNNIGLFFMIFVFWLIQSQAQAQIIINRISVIIVDERKTNQLRWGVFTLILILCNITGFLWIGHSLEISEVFARGDLRYVRAEGVIFIFVDVFLNLYFIKCVKKNLLDLGLEKYRPLVNFVIRIILISVGIDIVAVGTMSYHNPRIWLQLYPLGFIIKLNIELSMANLIAKIARQNDLNPGSLDPQLLQLSPRHDPRNERSDFNISLPQVQDDSDNAQLTLTKPQDALIGIESLRGRNNSAGSGEFGGVIACNSDEQPPQEEQDWGQMKRRRRMLSFS